MNKNININGCDDMQVDGTIHVNINKYLMFCPNDPIPGLVEPFVVSGKGQMMRDGTFDFSPLPPVKRRRGVLLKKVAHGRLSATKDGAYLLTLKVFKHEGLNVANVMSKEAQEAIEGGFRPWQK